MWALLNDMQKKINTVIRSHWLNAWYQPHTKISSLVFTVNHFILLLCMGLTVMRQQKATIGVSSVMWTILNSREESDRAPSAGRSNSHSFPCRQLTAEAVNSLTVLEYAQIWKYFNQNCIFKHVSFKHLTFDNTRWLTGSVWFETSNKKN